MSYLLAAEDLRAAYAPEAPVLRGINFQLEAGEQLGLSGKSGSGKTTLLRLCAGLAKLESAATVSGQLNSCGLDLLAAPEGQLVSFRQNTSAWVTEDPQAGLHPHRTLAASLRRFGLGNRYQQWFERLELPLASGFAERLPSEISGGQAQRVRLAFALARNPRLLLLESPTASLDPITAQLVLQQIEQSQRSGVAILHVTHDETLLDRVASRRLHLHHGQLMEPTATPSPPLTPLKMPAQAGTTSPVLQVDELRVNYKTVEAVRGVSFSVLPGETLALVGRSGSGKTSIGKALAGLVPSAGSVQLAEGGPARGAIQYVWQEPRLSLNPHFTVATTLREAHRRRGFDERALLEQVGLSEEYLQRQVLTLSTGEMQRVVLARALAVEPQVLVCDELMAGVDSRLRIALTLLLRRLQRELGLSIIYITHDLSAVPHLAHRMLILEDGEVVEQGPVEDVLQQPQAAITRALVAAGS